MRAAIVVLVMVAGCEFVVQGTDVPLAPDPGGSGGGGASPPSSTPSGSTTPPSGSPDLATEPPDMALARIGAPCTNNNQCASDLCGHSFGLISVPGGYCTQDCSGAKANTCPAGSTCTHLDGVGDYCLSNCPPDACRTGYKCCDFGGKGPSGNVCTPNQLCS